MLYGLLNTFLSGPGSNAGSWESEPATCSGYLDPENEDRKDFEAKLDGKSSHRDKPN
jgi:hypothetical protein